MLRLEFAWQLTACNGQIQLASFVAAAIDPIGLLGIAVALLKDDATVFINFTGIVHLALATALVTGVIDRDDGLGASGNNG